MVNIKEWILASKPDKTSYHNRLLELELLPLEYDREIKDLVFCFKSVNDCTSINPQTSKGGQMDPPIGFSDLKFEAFK